MPKAAQYFIQNRWPWLAASIILTVSLFVSTTVGWLWYADQRATAARQLSLDLLWLEQSIAESLVVNQKMLDNWAHDLAPATPKASEDFLLRVNGLMKENPALISVDHLDKKGNRVTGLPSYVERPDHLPPVNDPLIAEAIDRSIALGTPSYSHVIEQYAPLWVLIVPISNDTQNEGVVVATYDLNQLLSQKVPWWFVQRYDGCHFVWLAGGMATQAAAKAFARTADGATGASQGVAFP